MSQEAKDTIDLIRMGGKFYAMDGAAYCDTPLDTYRLVPGVGWVLCEEEHEDAS